MSTSMAAVVEAEMIGEKIGGELPALTRLKEVRLLPREEQDRLLAHEAEELAALFNEDLAKPSPERELAAFTALDGTDPLPDGEDWFCDHPAGL